MVLYHYSDKSAVSRSFTHNWVKNRFVKNIYLYSKYAYSFSSSFNKLSLIVYRKGAFDMMVPNEEI